MSEPVYFKTTCGSCDGHIEYPATSAGMNAGCPHCGKEVYLAYQYQYTSPPTIQLLPLQMTCDNCGKQIEYSSSSAGETVACPRCKHLVSLLFQSTSPTQTMRKEGVQLDSPPIFDLRSNKNVISNTPTALEHQQLKPSQATTATNSRDTAKTSGFDLFQKIRSRADAQHMIRGIGWIFFVFALLGLLAGIYDFVYLIGAFICAILGAALCWFNSRIAAIIMMFQSWIGVGGIVLANWLGGDETSGGALFTVFAVGIGMLQLIITIRAIEATFKYHGRYVSEILNSKPATAQSVALLVVGFVALIGVLYFSLHKITHP